MRKAFFQKLAKYFLMKFLIIQTAFIGDVVLATPLIEKLRRFFPDAQLDCLVRKGNERLLTQHPHLRQVLVWDKKKDKYPGLLRLARRIRRERYDVVINCQRFAASGLLTILSGAKETLGFVKNPLSRWFSRRLPHAFGTVEAPIHEVDRNLRLIEHLTDASFEPPRLYPAPSDFATAQALAAGQPYVCLAPTSVWWTKQFPAHKWLALLQRMSPSQRIFLLGGPDDRLAGEAIRQRAGQPGVVNLAGQISFLESAALMQGAQMNYVNDSAPLHIASSMNAAVTAVFCSTVPAFGFTPLSIRHWVLETSLPLACRPCGLHGYQACPLGHFACAETVDTDNFPLP